MSFRLTSESDEKWMAEGNLHISASGDGNCIQPGDDIYVLSGGESSKLLGRLSVLNIRPDPFRHRIDLTIGGPRSAVFFDNSTDAIPIRFPTAVSSSSRREASCLELETVQRLVGACGSHDFASPSMPVRWDAITRQVETTVKRANRDGDTRPAIEIAESFLRRSYVTSQLPGPAPVYQNAARLALGITREPERSQLRGRNELTDEAIQKAINEDVATAGHTPNTQRHQEILALLRNRLIQLGLVPKYDGLVDCIVESDKFDVYFEVKSASPESVIHQVRLALGQVLHYIWMDSGANSRAIRGHLIVQGPWVPENETLRAFSESCLVRLTWSQDIPLLEISDVESPLTM